LEKLIIEKVQIVDNLSEFDKPAWGIMTPQHMVEHLILVFKCSNGKLQAECFSPKEKLSTLKRVLMSERPFPKNFVSPATGSELKPLHYKSYTEAKDKLKKEVEDFYNYFELNPDSTTVNPTFGELSKLEWEKFHEKHLEHHFIQFNLL
jgi:oxepin-CoA hydrolase/3-oxo-5,6-dehydrosuberyl-CoA semialdehyde dehydrogenase